MTAVWLLLTILAQAADDEPIGRYLDDLEKSRRLPAESASPESLKATVQEAEDLLVRGDARAATTRLFALVESPRYQTWKDTPTFQDAEFLLGRSLLRGGAIRSAERYLLRVLAHGTDGPYFVPAHRSLVDLALETRAYGRMAGLLSARPQLPPDSASELAYLRGRAAYGSKDLEAATTHFDAVDRKSRLYPAAAYFRGLVAARRRRFEDARKAFCEIADQKDKLAFNVDQRYFAIKDLAHLALGRIAHEQDRYDEAYYFYFSIPDESEHLAEALFEAAHSMYQKGENDAARAFVDQFERLFPSSPLRAEVAILRANLDLKSCAFDRSRAAVAAVVGTYQPIVDGLAVLRKDQARRNALVDRLLDPAATLGPSGDQDQELLSLLKLDGRFGTLHDMAKAIDLDLAEATAAVTLWQALGSEASSRTAATSSSTEATQLLHEVEALAAAGTKDTALAQRLGNLLLDVSIAAHPPEKAGPYTAEARAAEELARRYTVLRLKVVEASRTLAAESFGELDQRLRAILRQTRLVQIDATVGKKKKLEREIANLYAGKIPPSLFHKLQAEGTLSDDEEYWPFEGEHWSDEYVNYR